MKVQRDALRAFLRINWSDVQKTLAMEDGTGVGGGAFTPLLHCLRV